MAQGRGSAAVISIAVMLCLVIVTEATDFKVGDSGGWTFNVVNWPKGKRFRSGDTLVFSYNPSFHDVVVVDKAGYDNCRASGSSKRYKSGNDRLKIAKGPNYFICSIAGHCDSGMKIAVTAA